MTAKPKSLLSKNAYLSMVRPLAWTGLALLVLILLLSLSAGRQYRQSAEWRDHSVKVLDTLGRLQRALSSVDAAERGYIIAKSPQFYEDYFSAKLSSERLMSELQALVVDEKGQTELVTRIRSIAAGKMAYLDSLMELTESGRQAEAVRAVRAGRGRSFMLQLDEAFKNFETREIELLKQRTAAGDKDFDRATFLVVGGLGFAFLFLLFTTYMLQREVNERKKIMDNLVLAEARANQASELKSRFLANMSHEIRTPLNGIVGMAKLLENTGLNEDQRDYLETMKISSNSLLALINQILDFSKIESGKMQLEEAPFELVSLIQSTFSIVNYSATAKGLTIKSSIAPGVPEFYLGDALRLRQVILNLLNNAIKFSEQGTIMVNVTKLKAWDSQVTLGFEVIDQGIGMDSETKAKLFQTFTQGDESTSRRFGGSGLGLAISKQITEMMNGHIGVESAPGKGSRFFFEIVLKVSKYGTEMRSESSTNPNGRTLGAHLLIAEDNRVNQKVVSEMMKMLGCTLKIVANGHEVLDCLRKEKFDLILMDGQMPEMDGYEATRRIRLGEGGAESRFIPVIATTANAIKGDIERCLAAGMNDYIGKPISFDDLSYKVEKWLRRGRDVIDRRAIDRLAALEKTSGAGLIASLVEVFEQEGQNGFDAMIKSLENGNLTGVMAQAHSLKSSAANLGALRLRELCEWIERSKNDPNAEHLALLVEAARGEFDVALKELKNKFVS